MTSHKESEDNLRTDFAGGPQISRAVKNSKNLFRLWREEIPKIPNILILFH